jgi:hypothetical protein
MSPFDGHDLNSLVASRERFGNFVYSSLDEVLDTWRRRQGGRFSGVRNETAIGAKVPSVLLGAKPVGVLFRHVGTPNYETRRVLRLCEERNIRLVIWEYSHDLFVTENRDKYALGRMGFYAGLGRNGGRRLEYVRVFDVEEMNRRQLRDIKTYRGENLFDFHHRLLQEECPELDSDTLVDGSQWFADHGGTARNYYPAFVSLFLRHAFLFETFVLQDEAERDFTRDVFLPVFQTLIETTGIRPMIVPAEREDWEGDDFWHLYPEATRRHLGPFRVRDPIAVETGRQWATPSDRETNRPCQTLRPTLIHSSDNLPKIVGFDDMR